MAYVFLDRGPKDATFIQATFKRYHTWRTQIHETPEQGTVFIGLISMPNINRQNTTWNAWMKKLNFQTNHEAFFVVNETPSIPDVKSMVPIKFKNKNLVDNGKTSADFDRAVKRLTAARYFLEKTNHKWFWTATDDIIIDVEAIDRMIYELEQKFDPDENIVFKGNCLYNGLYYLQGGSGYLMSRIATEIFVNKYSDTWLQNVFIYDDFYSNNIREFFNLGIEETSCGYMIGNWFFNNSLKKGFYKKVVEKCSDVTYKTTRGEGKCGTEKYPINKLVGLHLIQHKTTANIHESMKYILEAKEKDNSLYFYFLDKAAEFCRGEPFKIIDYFDNDYSI